MSAQFLQNGDIVHPPVTQAEKDELALTAKTFTLPLGEGVPLSTLRRPGSKVSLQRLEQVAKALVQDGVLVVQYRTGRKGGSFALWRIAS